jgi:hypothetical protein
MGKKLLERQVSLLKDAVQRPGCNLLMHGHNATHRAIGGKFLHNDMAAALPRLGKSHFLQNLNYLFA